MYRVVTILVLLIPLSRALAQDPAELAAGALGAFEAKCVQCHGPTLRRPKGHFGFVTNLRRLARDPDYIVPGSPQDSNLWLQIEDGEMPPDDARAGPLTSAEYDAILVWIKDGAATSAAQDGPPDQGGSGAGLATPPPSSAPNGTGRRSNERSSPMLMVLEFIGRFHVLVIHFPIALLIAAAVGEIWAAMIGQAFPWPSVRFCLALGAAAAIVAGGLGWLHELNEWGRPWTNLWFHRWLGTLAAVLAPGVAWLSERDVRRGSRSPFTRAAIIGSAALVGLAGHFGGMLTYGPDFFTP